MVRIRWAWCSTLVVDGRGGEGLRHDLVESNWNWHKFPFGFFPLTCWFWSPACPLVFEVDRRFARCHLDFLVRRRCAGVDRASLRVLPGGACCGGGSRRRRIRQGSRGCVEEYWASCTARGFSPVTIENDSGVLERVLALLGRPAWEVDGGGCGPGGRRRWPRGAGGVDPARICAGIQGVSPVPGVPQGGRDRGGVRRADWSARSTSSTPPGMSGTTRRRCCRRRRRSGWRILRVPEGPDRHGPEVRAGGPGLRVVPDAVSRRAAGRGGVAAGAGGRAFRPWPVRQAARPVRQGSPHVRAAAAVGADARRVGPGAAVVRAGCPGRFPDSPVLFPDESGGRCTAARSATGCGT